MKTINFAILPDLRKSIEITSKILATFDGEDRAYDMIQDHLGKLLALEMQILSNGISLEQKANVWYPDDSGWVEVPSDNNGIPAGLNDESCVEILTQHERNKRQYIRRSEYSYAWMWHEVGDNRIVAYKIVNP